MVSDLRLLFDLNTLFYMCRHEGCGCGKEFLLGNYRGIKAREGV